MLVTDKRLTYLDSRLAELSTVAVFGCKGTGRAPDEKNQAVLSAPDGFTSLFGFDIKKTVIVNQVHGIDTARTDAYGELSIDTKADAIITATPELPIGVLTADCLPILLFDPRTRSLGAVHAGWRGTVAGIAKNTVTALKMEFGSDPADIRAVIGPHIGPCCYTVGTEVIEALGGENSALIRDGDSIKFDLALANREELLNSGIKDDNILMENPCTICRGDLFYSYRHEGEKAGRQLSFIMLKG